jgi:VCBS repeat-containing protein
VALIVASGTIVVADGNGLGDIVSISIGGTTFDVTGSLESLVGQSVNTDFGQITITAYADGTYSYEYSLNTTVANDTQAGATDGSFVDSIAIAVSDGELTALGSIDISIRDDGPVASLVIEAHPAVLSEADLGTAFNIAQIALEDAAAQSTFGADGAGTRSYALEIAEDGADSGLRALDGSAITLHREPDGSIVGRSGDGNAVFSMAIDTATGLISITMLAAISHPADADLVQIETGRLFATLQITDADGDSDTMQVDMGPLVSFEDSIPVISSVQGGVIDNQAGLTLQGAIEAIAPDGIVGFDLAPSLALAPAGIVYTIDADGMLVATDALGETVFTLSIDASGQYTFTLLKPSAEAIASSPAFSGLVLEAGNPTTSATTEIYASYDPVTGAGIGDPVTSVVFSAGTQRLNPSNDGLGIDNNLIDDPKNGAPEVLSMSFADPLSNASLRLGNLSKGDALVWKVYQNGVLVDSGQISGSYIGADGLPVDISNSEAPTYWIDLSRNGLDEGVLFDRLEISAANDTSYKFMGFTVEKPITVDDLHLDFAAQAIDADGDLSAIAGFGITIDGSGNVLADMPGNTVLTGGAGADVFQWSLAEPGATDTVTDFSMASPLADGDILDLHDLLPPESSGNLASYLHFEASGDGGTLLRISTEGAFTGDPANDASVAYQTIELQNVDLMSLGTDQQIIDMLVNHGKLITE